jgi:hypothetical protein
VAGASRDDLEEILRNGLRTAEENSYGTLRRRWRGLLDGFVAISGAGES